MGKRICLAVTNDLTKDQRVHKVASYLVEKGHNVMLIGRKLKQSLPLSSRNYCCKRFILPFEKGAFFYLSYNIRLFFFLLFNRYHIIVANDLDTLTACYCAALLTKGGSKKVVYDSHEYFTQVPELVNRPRIQKIWTCAESLFLPHVKSSYTVCRSIADIYNKKYNIDMSVVRNVPLCNLKETNTTYANKIRPHINKRKVIIYQGAVNEGRGLEFLLPALSLLNNVLLIVCGDGDVLEDVKSIATNYSLGSKVIFTGAIPFEQLKAVTALADMGVSLEQNRGLNYYYALPNKLFDYIQAQIPVLTSDLPEIKKIVQTYNIGITTKDFTATHLASLIEEVLHNKYKRKLWEQGLLKAKTDLCWEKEVLTLDAIYQE